MQCYSCLIGRAQVLFGPAKDDEDGRDQLKTTVLCPLRMTRRSATHFTALPRTTFSTELPSCVKALVSNEWSLRSNAQLCGNEH